MSTIHQEGSVEHFWEVANHFQNGMMITATKSNLHHARPMKVLKADKSEGFWFMTSFDSPKIEELFENNLVCLSFQSNDRYLVVTGYAQVTRDKSKIHELWIETMKPWFPDGKNDSHIALIQVVPIGGEFWDFSGIYKKLKFYFEAAKSLVKETTINTEKEGNHAKVDLSQDFRK